MKINKFLLKAKNRAKNSHSSGSKALRKVKVKSTKDVKNKILIKKIESSELENNLKTYNIIKFKFR